MEATLLVLTRKKSEQIRIGQDLVITVTGIDRGRVQIGVTAPGSLPIFRQELLDRLGWQEGDPLPEPPRSASFSRSGRRGG